MAVRAAAAQGSARMLESGLRKWESMSRNAMVITFASNEVTQSGSSANASAVEVEMKAPSL